MPSTQLKGTANLRSTITSNHRRAPIPPDAPSRNHLNPSVDTAATAASTFTNLNTSPAATTPCQMQLSTCRHFLCTEAAIALCSERRLTRLLRPPPSSPTQPQPTHAYHKEAQHILPNLSSQHRLPSPPPVPRPPLPLTIDVASTTSSADLHPPPSPTSRPQPIILHSCIPQGHVAYPSQPYLTSDHCLSPPSTPPCAHACRPIAPSHAASPRPPAPPRSRVRSQFRLPERTHNDLTGRDCDCD